MVGTKKLASKTFSRPEEGLKNYMLEKIFSFGKMV